MPPKPYARQGDVRPLIERLGAPTYRLGRRCATIGAILVLGAETHEYEPAELGERLLSIGVACAVAGALTPTFVRKYAVHQVIEESKRNDFYRYEVGAPFRSQNDSDRNAW